MNAAENELVELTQRLLDSISNADWETYTKLCDPTLTAFEPEALGRLVHGMPFHKFYFDLGPSDGSRNTTVCDPHVRIMGDVAVIAADPSGPRSIEVSAGMASRFPTLLGPRSGS